MERGPPQLGLRAINRQEVNSLQWCNQTDNQWHCVRESAAVCTTLTGSVSSLRIIVLHGCFSALVDVGN